MSVEAWLNRFSLVFCLFMAVVLIIYIAITPILPSLPWVHFPTASHLQIRPLYESDVTVSVRADGSLYLFDRWVRPVDLTRGLRREKARRDDVEVCIRVDRAAMFGQVRLVAIAARDAGYRQITFMIDPASPTPSRPASPPWPSPARRTSAVPAPTAVRSRLAARRRR